MKFEERESPVEAMRRVPKDWDAGDALDKIVEKAVQDGVAEPSTAVTVTDDIYLPQVVAISPHENVLIYFNQAVENFGQVRIETCREGISFFVGSICVWRSFIK